MQGGITVAHQSGVYVGTWASNLAGWGTFGGANMELDLIGGVKRPIGGGTIDVVSLDSAVVAAGAGDLLTASVA